MGAIKIRDAGAKARAFAEALAAQRQEAAERDARESACPECAELRARAETAEARVADLEAARLAVSAERDEARRERDEELRDHLADHNRVAGLERANDLARLERDAARGVCAWSQNADGYYATHCGQAFVLEAGTPSENGMRYCCYCGSTLREAPFAEREERRAKEKNS